MGKIILHIDFDSFFASVEQQFNPFLRNRPIGVTAANGRTAIIAASREAKKLGIKSPTTTYEALKICPSMVFVKADFVKYFEISKKFLLICTKYSDTIEMFSIDELFMDITLTANLFEGTDKLILRLKQDIKNEIGEYITASVGISYNKLLAKLASGKKKPNGVFEITHDNLDEVYKGSQLTDICGIGRRISARLNELGVYHLLQLRTISEKALKTEFGEKEAEFLKMVAFASDNTPVDSFGNSKETKSVGRNYALSKNEYNQRIILQQVFELCEEIAIKLRRLNKKARTVGLSLRGKDSMHGRETVDKYMDTGRELFEVCLMFYRNWKWNGMVRQISVWAEGLKDRENVNASLFDNPRQEKLISTVDSLNERFGDHTIRNGFLLYADKLTTVPNGFMADRWERKKLIEEFKKL